MSGQVSVLILIVSNVISYVDHAQAQLYKEYDLAEPISIYQKSNFTGQGCLWPQPPARGYNFERCGEGVCPGTPGSVKPHGALMVTLCRNHHVMAHGESKAYCDNGVWTHKDFLCVECGRTTVHTESLILHGRVAEYKNFPWMAGIYLRNSSDKFVIACGGTLVSSHLVLSAAHCFKLNNGTLVVPENVKVGLGKIVTDLYTKEAGSLVVNVRQIVIQHHYKGLTLNFAQDIALVDLEEPVTLTPGSSIMPACVAWEGNETLVNDQTGFIAGYGTTEEGTTSAILKWTPQKYIDHSTCVNIVKPRNVQRLVPDKFCIKDVNGSRADKGDSGGGITFERENTHYVYGVVSNRLTNTDTDIVLFTSTHEHRYWLKETWDQLRRWHFQNTVSDIQATVGEVCKHMNEQLWYCSRQSQCPKALLAVNQNGAQPEHCKFIGNSIEDPIVCCEPDILAPPVTPSVSKNKCIEFGDVLNRQTRSCNIFRESLRLGTWTDVKKGDFPHLALISNDNFSSFRYATLVSDRFLISDALYSAILKTTGSPFKKAVLGALSFRTKSAVKYDIEEVIPHPEFKREIPHLHNVALFRLKTVVQFSPTIRPVCLQSSHVFPRSNVINTGNVLDTQEIKVLSKQNTTISARKECKINNNYINVTLVCVHISNGAAVDDVGGFPLAVRLEDPQCMYGLVGISNFYQLENKNKRAYTRISQYLQWIEGVLWPSQ